MASLTQYYGQMKAGVGNIDPKELAELGEDYMIVAGAGLGIGLLSGAIGGLDHKIAGFNVPVDGLISLGLGAIGLHLKSDALKVASIAIGGSASVRTFERFFKGAFHVKGDFEELASGGMGISGNGYYQLGPGVGFGAPAQDRLVEAARYL